MKTTHQKNLMLVPLLAGLAIAAPSASGQATEGLDRTVLPIREPQYPPITELDARNAKAPPRFEIKAPAAAPNVVIVLLDDIGFGQSGTFGGPCNMPTLDRLAANGLKYNTFHTCALCSPTRTALLTGRNHHVNNAGAIMELATAFPGNNGIRPNSVAPLAEMLRLNGYSTAAFGKYHETPPWEVSVSGPYDRWPTHSGFDKFYGFIGGETNQWAPAIFDGTIRVEPPHDPNYHFTTDMTNQAIGWMQAQHSLTPDRPFYVYFATGALHAPHHVPKEYIDKYKGKFDQGWDKLREETFARQKASGIIPQSAQLTPRPKEIPSWDSQTPDQKKLGARQMVTFAGFAEHTDHEVGRLVQALEQMGAMDNTLLIYIVGDNGASAEGGPEGAYNEMMALNGIISTAAINMPHLDAWGDPSTFPHYAIGWAWAGDTPFQWTKQIASHFGGTRNGMVMHWPKRIKAKGEIRSQFSHVTDIAPTALEAAGLQMPALLNGVPQKPIEGVSMVYSFDNAKASSTHRTQYFEMFANRAIYSDGWVAATTPPLAPWAVGKTIDVDDYKWELYDVTKDFSEANNLAAQEPKKLHELQELFWIEAAKNNVLPLDNSKIERMNVDNRPSLTRGRALFTYFPGMTRIPEGSAPSILNKSFKIGAEVEIPAAGTQGVLVTQGGRFNGWGLYLLAGKPVFHYNTVGVYRYPIVGPDQLSPGNHTILVDFSYDGGGLGKGGTATLMVDGKQVAQGRIERTIPFRISADETLDIGEDTGTPVSEDYHVPFKFTGDLKKVAIQLTDAKLSAEDEAEIRRIRAEIGLSE